MSHTPGPWTAIKSPSEEDVWHVKAQPSPAMRGFTKEIAFVDGYENALLIASAPKMHAEIERLKAALTSLDWSARRTTIQTGTKRETGWFVSDDDWNGALGGLLKEIFRARAALGEEGKG